MTPLLLALLPASDPWLGEAARCAVTGICPVATANADPHSGTMYLAVGLVLAGVAGLRRLSSRDRGSSATS